MTVELSGELIEQVNAFLAEEFEVDAANITPDADMRAVLDLDSLDFIDLVVVLEKNFGVKANAEDFDQFRTFSEFYIYLQQRLNSVESR